MSNYQKIIEMLLRYGTPEIEAEVMPLVRDCIFKYSDIDKIELSDYTIYRNPWKNAIKKIEEAFPASMLSEEEKTELLNFLKKATEENYHNYFKKIDEDI